MPSLIEQIEFPCMLGCLLVKSFQVVCLFYSLLFHRILFLHDCYIKFEVEILEVSVLLRSLFIQYSPLGFFIFIDAVFLWCPYSPPAVSLKKKIRLNDLFSLYCMTTLLYFLRAPSNFTRAIG